SGAGEGNRTLLNSISIRSTARIFRVPVPWIVPFISFQFLSVRHFFDTFKAIEAFLLSRLWPCLLGEKLTGSLSKAIVAKRNHAN
ncbi:hypothetical protein, partial [Pseudomonas aeruginosa]|uniref:hypothetical protein n=1 Tax=Pseudomonas aeruginosa TaxID=287 RepID=UPI00195542E8